MKRRKTFLLIEEPTYQVLPSLATRIGLNEALFLQQVHFYLSQDRHVLEGKSWIYNTLDDWERMFPFWSRSTIRRTIESLKNMDLLLIGNFNKKKSDRTLWYSINYEAFAALEQTTCSKRTTGNPEDEHNDLSGMNTSLKESKSPEDDIQREEDSPTWLEQQEERYQRQLADEAVRRQPRQYRLR